MFAVFRKVVLTSLLILAVLMTGAWQSNATASHESQSTNIDETLLYPGLTWSDLGLSNQNIRININGDSIVLSGERYEAREQFVSDLPLPSDLVNYYSNERLGKSGWISYDTFEDSDGIHYVFYHESGAYLLVEFVKCQENLSRTCVAVWKSEQTDPQKATSITTDEPEILQSATTGTFGKIAPSNGATNLSPSSVVLSWEAYSPTPYKYSYCVNEGSACPSKDPDWTSTYNTSITLTNLAYNKTYYWQVRAVTCISCVPKTFVYANGGTAWTFKTKLNNQATIVGNAGVSGAVLSYVDGTLKTVTTDSTGAYSIKVPLNWSGTITPSKAGYLFTPKNASFSNLTAAQTIQNFLAVVAYTISGNAGVSGATLSYTDGTPQTVLSNSSGNYSIMVPPGWSGTVTPSKAGYLFSPANKTYSNIQSNQTLQNFTPYVFADVPPTHPFWRYVEAFYKAGITSGCSLSPKMYCPDDLVTRGEMAVFIERAKGNFNPQPNPTGMFADLPYLTFTPFIEQLYNDGITTGCSSNPLMYCPTNNVNRAEMATFIERAIGHFNPQPNPTGMFTDLPYLGLEALTPFIELFYNDGITTGCQPSPLMFCPANKVTRGEMAVFIVRAFHIPLP